MTADKLARTLDRIAKIRELATTERGATQGEAEAAAARIAEIMLRYGLSEDDLNAADPSTALAQERFIFAPEMFRLHLLALLATNHSGVAVALIDDLSAQNFLAEVFAPKYQMGVIRETFEWLQREIVQLAHIYHAEASEAGDLEAIDRPYTWKKDFHLGAIRGLKDAYAKMRGELQESLGDQYGLVLVKDQEAVKFAESQIDDMSYHLAPVYAGDAAFNSGRDAGSRINLDIQLGVSSTNGQLHA